ncbi:hypothetical protein K435DRAFT_860620 [Dendrothele bispora CBS 962.96]|uniref:Uncharacterized protein n=1 Tax=Dendrothele bispora (strain CBS 962.96) TaxID=1314807 RepID=A0A4S8LXE6_DENBC|nr:hypothetical protein K435DRAFT_860620 [Dendrothele bispora CBS 962.96]
MSTAASDDSLPLLPCNSSRSRQSSQSRRPSPGMENNDPKRPDPDRLERLSDKKKRKRNQTEDHLKPFKHAAQWFSRTQSLYIAIGVNIHAAWALSSNPEDPLIEGMSDADKEWHLTTYEKFLKHTPGLRTRLLELMDEAKSEELEHFVAWLESQASQGRTADTNMLKSQILVYMLDKPLTDVLDPPISPAEQTKANRGFKHPYIASLLCPRKYRLKFLANPSKIMQKIKDGVIKINNTSLPSLCFDLAQFDDADPFKGLFMNMTLIRAGRAILFGESKAINGIEHHSRAPRKSNARHNGIKRVQEGFIAMVRFSLSSVESWEIVDKEFRYDIFHKQVIARFVRKDEWAISTLKWWNEQLFGRDSPEHEDDQDEDDSDADLRDDIENMDQIQEERWPIAPTASPTIAPAPAPASAPAVSSTPTTTTSTVASTATPTAAPP